MPPETQICLLRAAMRHHQRRQGAWSGGGPDFAGQSCVERAGLMDLLRWRHVDMPRARVQVRVRILRPSRTPLAISCSLFYGSLVLKLEVPAGGRSAGVASCKWKGWQWHNGAGVRAGGRGPSSFLPITARLVPLSRRFGLSQRIRNFIGHCHALPSHCCSRGQRKLSSYASKS